MVSWLWLMGGGRNENLLTSSQGVYEMLSSLRLVMLSLLSAVAVLTYWLYRPSHSLNYKAKPFDPAMKSLRQR